MKQKVKVLEINYMIWGCPKISGQRIPVIYKLVAMITHVGPSLNCGHYTATSSSWETLLESSLRTSASGPDDNATDVGTVGCVVIREGPKRERPMTRPQTDSSRTRLDPAGGEAVTNQIYPPVVRASAHSGDEVSSYKGADKGADPKQN